MSRAVHVSIIERDAISRGSHDTVYRNIIRRPSGYPDINTRLTPTAAGRHPTDTEDPMSDGTQSDAVHAPLLMSPVSCPNRTMHISKPAALANSRS